MAAALALPTLTVPPSKVIFPPLGVQGEEPPLPAAAVVWIVPSGNLKPPARLIVDQDSGSVGQRLEFDEFGKVLVDTASRFQAYGYAGGLYEHHSKTIKFGARAYHADIGRWGSKDPARFQGEDFNLYSYAFLNPVNYIDRNGRLPQIGTIGVAVVAVSACTAAYLVWDHILAENRASQCLANLKAEDRSKPGTKATEQEIACRSAAANAKVVETVDPSTQVEDYVQTNE